MAKIIIPTPLRKFTADQVSIEVVGGNVKSAIENLADQFPDLKKHLFDADGKIRQFIRIYVGDEDIDALDGEDSKVSEDTTISIIPAIAGGNKL